MKKKLFLISSIILMTSVTLSGCDKQTKLDTDKGEEITQSVKTNTQAEIKKLSQGNFLGTTLDASASFNAVVTSKNMTSLLTSEDTSESDDTILYSAQGNVSALGQANLSLDNLKKETPSLENSSAYGKVSADISYQVYQEENTLSVTDMFYMSGDKYVNVSEENDEQKIDRGTFDEEATASFASYVCETLDVIAGTNENYNEIKDQIEENTDLSYIDQINYISDLYTQYQNGDITEQEFVESILEYTDLDDMGFSSETITDIIDNYDQYDPMKFMSYEKSTSKKITTLKTTFDYDGFKEALIQTLISIRDSYSILSTDYVAMNTLNTYASMLLPNSVTLEYSLVFNQDNLLNGFIVNVAAKGSINNLYNYDLSASASANFTYQDSAVTITTDLAKLLEA